MNFWQLFFIISGITFWASRIFVVIDIIERK